MQRHFTKNLGYLHGKTKQLHWSTGVMLLTLSVISMPMAESSPVKKPAPVVEVHRQGVSIKDSTGLYPAQSTLGNFSVLMPIPFNDFSILTQRGDGSPLRMDCIGGKTTEGVKFMITSAPWFQKKPELKDLYESFRKDEQVLSKPKYKEQGLESSVTFEATQKDSRSWIRYTVTPTMIFCASVEYPRDQQEMIARQAEIFLDSLKIKQPK